MTAVEKLAVRYCKRVTLRSKDSKSPWQVGVWPGKMAAVPELFQTVKLNSQRRRFPDGETPLVF